MLSRIRSTAVHHGTIQQNDWATSKPMNLHRRQKRRFSMHAEIRAETIHVAVQKAKRIVVWGLLVARRRDRQGSVRRLFGTTPQEGGLQAEDSRQRNCWALCSTPMR